MHSSFHTGSQVILILQKIKSITFSLPEENPQKKASKLLSAFTEPVMPGCLKSCSLLSQLLTSLRVPSLQNYFQLKANHYNFAIPGPVITRIHSLLAYFPWPYFFLIINIHVYFLLIVIQIHNQKSWDFLELFGVIWGWLRKSFSCHRNSRLCFVFSCIFC